MSGSNSLTLPVITVQHTYPDVIHEVKQGIIPREKFWVSCYKIGEQSFHGKVYVELDEVNRDLVVLKPEEEGLEVQAEGKCVRLLNNLL
jgi:proteasomal ATPase-associated factor 1